MIDEITNYFEKLSENFGIIIKLPRPSKKVQRFCSYTNALIGISFILLGILAQKGWIISLGILGIIGAWILKKG